MYSIYLNEIGQTDHAIYHNISFIK